MRPLVSTTSPTITAWSLSSSIRRSRALMRAVLYPRARRPSRLRPVVARRAGAGPRMSDAGLTAPRFGAAPELSLGLEDELPLVDPETRALSHTAVELLERLEVPESEGTAKPDTYAAMVELTA